MINKTHCPYTLIFHIPQPDNLDHKEYGVFSYNTISHIINIVF